MEMTLAVDPQAMIMLQLKGAEYKLRNNEDEYITSHEQYTLTKPTNIYA